MKTIILILLIVNLSGCGIAYNIKVRDEVLASPATDASVKELIRQKKIRAGMTKKEVEASWGGACGYCKGTRRTSAGDWWEYNPFGSGRYSAGNGTYLFFGADGRLQYWNGN